MLYGASRPRSSRSAGVPWTFDARRAYVLSLVYLALFGSVFAFGAYLTLLKRVGAGPSSFVGVATPVIALAAVDAVRRATVDASASRCRVGRGARGDRAYVLALPSAGRDARAR